MLFLKFPAFPPAQNTSDGIKALLIAFVLFELTLQRVFVLFVCFVCLFGGFCVFCLVCVLGRCWPLWLIEVVLRARSWSWTTSMLIHTSTMQITLMV